MNLSDLSHNSRMSRGWICCRPNAGHHLAAKGVCDTRPRLPGLIGVAQVNGRVRPLAHRHQNAVLHILLNLHPSLIASQSVQAGMFLPYKLFNATKAKSLFLSHLRVCPGPVRDSGISRKIFAPTATVISQGRLAGCNRQSHRKPIWLNVGFAHWFNQNGRSNWAEDILSPNLEIPLKAPGYICWACIKIARHK